MSVTYHQPFQWDGEFHLHLLPGLVVELPGELRSPAWIRWWSSVMDGEADWTQMPHPAPLVWEDGQVYLQLDLIPKNTSIQGGLSLVREFRVPLDRELQQALLQCLETHRREANWLRGAQVAAETLEVCSVLNNCQISGIAPAIDLSLTGCRGAVEGARVCRVFYGSMARVCARDLIVTPTGGAGPSRQQEPCHLGAPVVVLDGVLAGMDRRHTIQCQHLVIIKWAGVQIDLDRQLPTLVGEETFVSLIRRYRIIHYVWREGHLHPLGAAPPPPVEGALLDIRWSAKRREQILELRPPLLVTRQPEVDVFLEEAHYRQVASHREYVLWEALSTAKSARSVVHG